MNGDHHMQDPLGYEGKQGVVTGAAMLRQWPEIRRYMKMRQM